MTASVLPEDQTLCRTAGMSDFVAKPIDVPGLFATLGRWVNGLSSPASTTQSAPPARVPDIPGLNSEDGLRRSGGDWPLYLRLLDKYRRHHAHSLDELNAALAKGDETTAQQLLHALKGVSGNIGAQAVYAACQDTQAALTRQSADPPRLQAALGRLESALNDLLTGVDAHLAGLPERPLANAPGPGDFQPLWDTLQHLVEDNDTAAMEALAPARAASPRPEAAEWLDLENHLAKYDFAAASLSLQQLSRLLSPQP